MANKNDKIIGVIGGLGPQATLDFCQRLLRNTQALSEQDHLHCIVDNNPKAPNRNEAIAGRGPSPASSFAASAKMLATAGADFIVMPCNTAHAFDAAITDAVELPFVSIIDETCDFLQREFPAVQHIGLLAADGCLEAQLYQIKLTNLNKQVVTLDAPAQARFMQTIYGIKSRGVESAAHQQMLEYARALMTAGAQLIVAACTEVPMVLKPEQLTVPLLESTEILARQCVKYAKCEQPLPL